MTRVADLCRDSLTQQPSKMLTKIESAKNSGHYPTSNPPFSESTVIKLVDPLQNASGFSVGVEGAQVIISVIVGYLLHIQAMNG